MKQAILTASGTAADVCEKLKILTAIFPKGGDPCGSGDGDEIRKTKNNHTATAGRNRKTARLTANGGRRKKPPKNKK